MCSPHPAPGEAHTCHICLKQFSRRDLRERHRRRCEKSIGKVIPTKKRSCERCISFKVKCDYSKPSCGRCASRAVQCEYKLEPKIKMPANPAYKAPVPKQLPAKTASKPGPPPALAATTTPYLMREIPDVTPDMTDMMLNISPDMAADFGSDTTWPESSSPWDAWSDAPSSLGDPMLLDVGSPDQAWAISLDPLHPAMCMDAGDGLASLSFYADPLALSGTLHGGNPAFGELYW